MRTRRNASFQSRKVGFECHLFSDLGEIDETCLKYLHIVLCCFVIQSMYHDELRLLVYLLIKLRLDSRHFLPKIPKYFYSLS